MKPFDIEKAKAGQPICTRDKRSVRIVCFDMNNIQPIVAIVKEYSTVENVYLYCKNGRADYIRTSWDDLFMDTE